MQVPLKAVLHLSCVFAQDLNFLPLSFDRYQIRVEVQLNVLEFHLQYFYAFKVDNLEPV